MKREWRIRYDQKWSEQSLSNLGVLVVDAQLAMPVDMDEAIDDVAASKVRGMASGLLYPTIWYDFFVFVHKVNNTFPSSI